MSSLLPVGITVRTLNNLVNELRGDDLWAERHSYSVRIMYKGLIVASLHFYPGYHEAVLRLYGDEEANRYVYSRVKSLTSKYLPNYTLRAVNIKHVL